MNITAKSVIPLAILGFSLHAAAESESSKIAPLDCDNLAASSRVSLQERRGALNNRKREVGRQAASHIAKRVIERRTGRAARVTGIEREDDFGARWEVEVTAASGREFDVYVNAAGGVVRIVRKSPDNQGDNNPATEASRNEASAIALAHVRTLTGQVVRVTGIGREDDYGARWEVEITRADGFEYDVYVNAKGQVVRTEEVGFDG